MSQGKQGRARVSLNRAALVSCQTNSGEAVVRHTEDTILEYRRCARNQIRRSEMRLKRGKPWELIQGFDEVQRRVSCHLYLMIIP